MLSCIGNRLLTWADLEMIERRRNFRHSSSVELTPCVFVLDCTAGFGSLRGRSFSAISELTAGETISCVSEASNVTWNWTEHFPLNALSMNTPDTNTTYQSAHPFCVDPTNGVPHVGHEVEFIKARLRIMLICNVESGETALLHCAGSREWFSLPRTIR